MHLKRLICCAAVALGASAAIATTAAFAGGSLSGAGSTLVAPLEAEWAHAFQSSTGNSVSYAAVGSGTGISDISHSVVDFGASDAPMTTAQASGCSNCLQIPWALSATGIGYHINALKSGLHLTGPILAGIYLGQITNWDDPQITKINKGMKLPNLKITPVFRSDGSGDTFAFTHFLSQVNATWASTKSFATTVNFTVGISGKGNSGVAADVTSTNGSIGYISGAYLIAQHISTAAIQNQAGNFEFPNINSIINAAQQVTSASLGGVQTPAGLSVTNAPKKFKIAYPISTFTYVIAPKGGKNDALVKQFIMYALTTGRSMGIGADFAPLPTFVQKYDETETNQL